MYWWRWLDLLWRFGIDQAAQHFELLDVGLVFAGAVAGREHLELLVLFQFRIRDGAIVHLGRHAGGRRLRTGGEGENSGEQEGGGKKIRTHVCLPY